MVFFAITPSSSPPGMVTYTPEEVFELERLELEPSEIRTIHLIKKVYSGRLLSGGKD